MSLDFSIPSAGGSYQLPQTTLDFWIRDLAPGAPVVSPEAFSVSEDALIGTLVGAVEAVDPDEDDLTWSITAGNVGGAFAIDPDSGEITTAAALDYETRASYALTVRATDPGGLWGSATITITVLDVGEVVLEPAPSHILGIGLPWGMRSARDMALRLPWAARRPLDLAVLLQYQQARPIDAGSTLAWRDPPALDVGAALPWADAALQADVGTELVWRDPPARDLSAALAWDESWQPRDQSADLVWRHPPIRDLDVRVVYREVDLSPPAGDWYALPAVILPGTGVLLEWRKGFDFRVRQAGDHHLPAGALNFSVPVLPPDELQSPVLLSWAPIRAPQLQPVAVDRLIGLPWHIPGQRDRDIRITWGLGKPVISDPVDIPWESEPPEPTWIVVPPLPVYNVMNSISVVRLPERTPINPLAVSVSHDDEAFAWRCQLTLFSAAEMALLKPTLAGAVKTVEISINGFVVIANVESFSRDRQYPQTTWTLQCRSIHAELDAPYSQARSLVSTSVATANQLALEELPAGWTLDWDVPDWVIPAGAWSYDQLTPIRAIARLAAAVGAVVQPDPASKHLVVRSRYPVSPSGWPAATLHASISEAVCSRMGSEFVAGEARNAVIVAGATQGVRIDATRIGTAGDNPLPGITEQLCTAVECGMERARVELDSTGARLDERIALPVLDSLGVVETGKLLEVPEAGVTWRGLSRGVSVAATRGQKGVLVGQTLTIERRA